VDNLDSCGGPKRRLGGMLGGDELLEAAVRTCGCDPLPKAVARSGCPPSRRSWRVLVRAVAPLAVSRLSSPGPSRALLAANGVELARIGAAAERRGAARLGPDYRDLRGVPVIGAGPGAIRFTGPESVIDRLDRLVSYTPGVPASPVATGYLPS